MPDDEDPGPLAHAVKARRLELGYTQGELQEYGGPGLVTVREIEKGRMRNPRDLTLVGLDKALMWESGSAAAAVRGEPPRVQVHAARRIRERQWRKRGSDPVAEEMWKDVPVPVGPSSESAEYVAHPGPEGESLDPVTSRELLEEIRRVARDVEDIKRRLDGS